MLSSSTTAPLPAAGAMGATADEVAVVGDAGLGLLVLEVADAGGGRGQLAGELVRRGWVVGETEEVVDRDAERLGGAGQSGVGEAAPALLDLRDQVLRAAGAVAELLLRQPLLCPHQAKALGEQCHGD